MVKLTKNQLLIILVIFFISPLIQRNFETNPHIIIGDLIYIFIFSLFISIFLLKLYKSKEVKNRFFVSYTHLLLFVGLIFIASSFLPFIISCLERKEFCLDNLFMLVGGIGIIIGAKINKYI
jgi:hypothetical protein